jgi:hypothetical protein
MFTPRVHLLPTLITTTITRPPEISVRHFRDAMRDAWRALGEKWHREFLPLHFREDAKRKYRHQPRSTRYLAEKRAAAGGSGWWYRLAQRVGRRIEGGGAIDNVLTGRMRDALLHSARMIAFPTRLTVRMIGPRYMTFTPNRNSVQPNKTVELTRLTPAEETQLREFFGQIVKHNFANRPPQPQTVQT